jgi:hypothetical protein
VIEVPPPHSTEARQLRYGAMTCRQYIFMRSKWAFAACVWTTGIGLWEFSIGKPWSWVLGIILLFSTAVNLWVAARWRYSWRFWHQALGSWLDRQESLQELELIYERRRAAHHR